MGQSESKQNQYINYRVFNKDQEYILDLKKIDLKVQFIMNSKQIENIFNEYVRSIILNQSQKNYLKKLSNTQKYNLIQMHQMNITCQQKYKNNFKNMVDYFIDKLAEQNPFLIERLLKWLENSNKQEIMEFVSKGGSEIIQNLINNDFKDKNCIQNILKIFLIITEQIDEIEISYNVIIKLVQLYNNEHNTLIVQILSNLCWMKDQLYQQIQMIFSKYPNQLIDDQIHQSNIGNNQINNANDRNDQNFENKNQTNSSSSDESDIITSSDDSIDKNSDSDNIQKIDNSQLDQSKVKKLAKNLVLAQKLSYRQNYDQKEFMNFFKYILFDLKNSNHILQIEAFLVFINIFVESELDDKKRKFTRKILVEQEKIEFIFEIIKNKIQQKMLNQHSENIAQSVLNQIYTFEVQIEKIIDDIEIEEQHIQHTIPLILQEQQNEQSQSEKPTVTDSDTSSEISSQQETYEIQDQENQILNEVQKLKIQIEEQHLQIAMMEQNQHKLQGQIRDKDRLIQLLNETVQSQQPPMQEQTVRQRLNTSIMKNRPSNLSFENVQQDILLQTLNKKIQKLQLENSQLQDSNNVLIEQMSQYHISMLKSSQTNENSQKKQNIQNDNDLSEDSDSSAQSEYKQKTQIVNQDKNSPQQKESVIPVLITPNQSLPKMGAPNLGPPQLGPPKIGLGPPKIGLGPPKLGGIGLQQPSLGIGPGGIKAPIANTKKIMWQPIVKDQIIKSIFVNFQDDQDTNDIPYEELEQEFSIKKIEEKPTNIVKKNDKIEILKPERRRNFEIILGRLKMKNEKICEAVLHLDENILTDQIQQSLIQCSPNEDEIRMLRKFDSDNGDISKLGIPEKFVYDVQKKIPYFKERLQSLLFKYQYPELLKDLIQKMKLIQQVMKVTRLFQHIYGLFVQRSDIFITIYLCKNLFSNNLFLKDLRNDELIIQIFKLILKFGNYLNANNKPHAFGFRLEVLEKIGDIKTADQKNNFLQYILRKITNIKQFEKIKIDELNECSRLGIEQLRCDLNDIKIGLDQVQLIMKNKVDEKDLAEEKFKDFENMLLTNIEFIDDQLKECQDQFEKSCEYFCESPKDLKSIELATKLRNFMVLVNKNLVKIEEEEKRNKRINNQVRRGALNQKKPQAIAQRRDSKRMSIIGIAPDVQKKTSIIGAISIFTNSNKRQSIIGNDLKNSLKRQSIMENDHKNSHKDFTSKSLMPKRDLQDDKQTKRQSVFQQKPFINQIPEDKFRQRNKTSFLQAKFDKINQFNKVEYSDNSLNYIKENQPIEYDLDDMRERILSFSTSEDPQNKTNQNLDIHQFQPPENAFKKSNFNKGEIELPRKRNISTIQNNSIQIDQKNAQSQNHHKNIEQEQLSKQSQKSMAKNLMSAFIKKQNFCELINVNNTIIIEENEN